MTLISAIQLRRKEGAHLSERTDQEELPSASGLDQRVGSKGSESVDGDEDSTEDKGELTVKSEVLLKDLEKYGESERTTMRLTRGTHDRGEVNDSVASTDLLHDLGRSLRIVGVKSVFDLGS